MDTELEMGKWNSIFVFLFGIPPLFRQYHIPGLFSMTFVKKVVISASRSCLHLNYLHRTRHDRISIQLLPGFSLDGHRATRVFACEIAYYYRVLFGHYAVLLDLGFLSIRVVLPVTETPGAVMRYMSGVETLFEALLVATLFVESHSMLDDCRR